LKTTLSGAGPLVLSTVSEAVGGLSTVTSTVAVACAPLSSAVTVKVAVQVPAAYGCEMLVGGSERATMPALADVPQKTRNRLVHEQLAGKERMLCGIATGLFFANLSLGSG
jgi:hypothetical protein